VKEEVASPGHSITHCFSAVSVLIGNCFRRPGGLPLASTRRIALPRYLLCGASRRPFRKLFQRAKAKGFGRAGRHAGGLPSLGNQIHAEVALLHLSVGTELGHSKGTGHQTKMTAEAFLPIDHHNPVFRPLSNGAPWTCVLTRWIPTMQTGEGNTSVCDCGKGTTPNGYYPSPFYAPFDVM
jgi:hypothetical protein